MRKFKNNWGRSEDGLRAYTTLNTAHKEITFEELEEMWINWEYNNADIIHQRTRKIISNAKSRSNINDKDDISIANLSHSKHKNTLFNATQWKEHGVKTDACIFIYHSRMIINTSTVNKLTPYGPQLAIYPSMDLFGSEEFCMLPLSEIDNNTILAIRRDETLSAAGKLYTATGNEISIGNTLWILWNKQTVMVTLANIYNNQHINTYNNESYAGKSIEEAVSFACSVLKYSIDIACNSSNAHAQMIIDCMRPLMLMIALWDLELEEKDNQTRNDESMISITVVDYITLLELEHLQTLFYKLSNRLKQPELLQVKDDNLEIAMSTFISQISGGPEICNSQNNSFTTNDILAQRIYKSYFILKLMLTDIQSVPGTIKIETVSKKNTIADSIFKSWVKIYLNI